MTDLKTLVQGVYSDAFLLHLGVQDQAGPWVASLIYVFDEEFNLYWISLPTARHSLAIAQNPNVACSIVASYETKKERGVQVEGVATIVTDMPLEREQALERKRGQAIPTEAGQILVGGHQWYKLTPNHIELIHSEPFGYERKRYL